MPRLIQLISLLLLFMVSCTQAQKNVEPYLVGGPCEGCEAILEYNGEALNEIDTLPDFHNNGQKIMIYGTVYKSDGITPAKDVIIYVYHTNQNGRYQPGEEADDWERHHGALRGWMKTNKLGAYKYYTLKPAPYPNRAEPAHIHYTILEPNGKYYWLESLLFEDDPLLAKEDKNQKTPRGGTDGVVTIMQNGELWEGKRDIILGKNIPGYE